MKIIFANIVIATGPEFGGSDAIQGFTLDEADQVVQEVAYLRATDMTAFPRGNRKRTMTGTVTRGPSATLAAAMAARAALYDSLPTSGALVTVQGVQVETWSAILKSYRALKLKGVSYGFTLTFVLNGPAVPSTLNTVLGTGVGGNVLGDGHGHELGTGI